MFWDTGWSTYVKHNKDVHKPKLTSEAIKRAWGFAHPYRWHLVLLLLATLMISILSLLSPLLIKMLIDDAIPNRNFRQLNFIGLSLVLLPIMVGLLGLFERYVNSRIGEGVIHDLRCALYSHLETMSLHFFTQSQTGEIMARFNNDIFGAQQAISSTLTTILSNILTFLVAFFIMLALDWRLTILSLAILPIFVIAARRIASRLRGYRYHSMELMAELSTMLNETLNISGVLLMKLFAREELELNKFTKQSIAVRDIRNQEAITSQWLRVTMNVVVGFATGVVYWVGGYLVFQGNITLGTLIAFGGYLIKIYTPLVSLSNAPLEFLQSMISFERVFEVLDIPQGIEEHPDAISLGRVQGSLRFDEVHFGYQSGELKGLQQIIRFVRGGSEAHLKRDTKKKSGENGKALSDKEQWALRSVSFSVEPGQLVALVGPSGAGKTTITSLIPRLYDPSKGIISIDGYNTKDITLKSLMDNIGMVTQDSYLFYDTIRANLLYAKSDATEDEIFAAAKAANIHDFIMTLPDGYDTLVGQRGHRLSGGERQRISLARVILKDPRILILDEATSHLDSISEALIQEALEKVMKGRTSIVIAHRLSTILAADKILVVDKGSLVDQGSHQELVTRGGLYTILYKRQFNES